MLLVNFKARQDPPPTQCPLFFPLEPRPLYFQAKRRRVSTRFAHAGQAESSCMTQSNFFADQQLTLWRNMSKK